MMYVFLLLLGFAIAGSVEARTRKLLRDLRSQHVADLAHLERKLDTLLVRLPGPPGDKT